jgi:hypothetical protein
MNAARLTRPKRVAIVRFASGGAIDWCGIQTRVHTRESVRTRAAECACGRLTMTVEGEPLHVFTCHCDFCQKRTGSVIQVSATFASKQVVSISGDTTRFNGFEVDGVPGHPGVPAGLSYHFCSTCGSTVYWSYVTTSEITGGYTLGGKKFVGVAVGNFVDPDFALPTFETGTAFRHHWVALVPGTEQFETYPADPTRI